MLGPMLAGGNAYGSTSSSNGATSTSNGNSGGGGAPPRQMSSPQHPHAMHQITSTIEQQQQSQDQPSSQSMKLYSYKLVQLNHSYPGSPFGFHNEGNYCYMISVLQSLLHTPAFINFVLGSHSSACRVQPGADRWCAVCEFLRYYNRYRQGGCDPACYPRAFMARVTAISPTLRHNRQEDAHEFLRCLLDYMEANCLHGYAGLEQKHRASNPIRVLFCGKLKSSVICSRCESHSQTFDDFMDLSLCIQQSDSLEDSMQRFVTADLLKDSNAYKCERCRVKVTAKKSFSIAVGPPILTVQLNRFQWGQNNKIGKFVRFPLVLDIRPYMSKRGKPVNYELYSVIVHHGNSTKFGHYYSYAMRNGTWWSLNDAAVSRITETRVLNSCPYILFYRRADLSALVNNGANNRAVASSSSTASPEAPSAPSALADSPSATAAAPPPASTNGNCSHTVPPSTPTAGIRLVVSTAPVAAAAVGAFTPTCSPRPQSQPVTCTSKPVTSATFLPRQVFVLKNNSNTITSNASPGAAPSPGNQTNAIHHKSPADLLQFMQSRRGCGITPSASAPVLLHQCSNGAADSLHLPQSQPQSPTAGAASPTTSSAASPASGSGASSCIRLKIHKLDGNKFSCVPVPLQLQQLQQQLEQPHVISVTPQQPSPIQVTTPVKHQQLPEPLPKPLPQTPVPTAATNESLPTPHQQQQQQQQPAAPAGIPRPQIQPSALPPVSSALKRKAASPNVLDHKSAASSSKASKPDGVASTCSSSSSSDYEWVEASAATAVKGANGKAGSRLGAANNKGEGSSDSSSDSDDDSDSSSSSSSSLAKNRPRRHCQQKRHSSGSRRTKRKRKSKKSKKSSGGGGSKSHGNNSGKRHRHRSRHHSNHRNGGRHAS